MDAIHIEIKLDGTIVVTTDTISGPNHINADRLLSFLANLQGGPVHIKKRHTHSQHHTHTHTHITAGGNTHE